MAKKQKPKKSSLRSLWDEAVKKGWAGDRNKVAADSGETEAQRKRRLKRKRDEQGF